MYLDKYTRSWLLDASIRGRITPSGCLSMTTPIDKWIQGMAMWERRVHVTHMLRNAYDRACKLYDFEKNAKQIGMLLTIDGTDDDLIQMQGLKLYGFSDADGGSEVRSSDDEPDSGSDVDPDEYVTPIREDDVGNSGEGVASDSEVEDDMALVDAAAAAQIPVAFAPVGFVVVAESPHFGCKPNLTISLGSSSASNRMVLRCRRIIAGGVWGKSRIE
jgi:hypothetical protein